MVKKKVLLVYANAYSYGNLPICIAMITAVLKNKYKIKLFDTTFYPKKFTKAVKFRENTLEYKKTNKDLPSLNTTDLYEDFDKVYNEFKPDIILISATSGDYKIGLNLLEKVNVPVIFGGIHATVAPEDLIKHKKVTHVFRGEAEEILSNLIKKIINNEELQGFEGVWYKKNNKIIKNNKVPIVKDLNKLPMPEWSFFDKRHFYKPFSGNIYRIGHIELSRGCPYSCTYCVNHVMERLTNPTNPKAYYREKSVDRALEEIKFLTKKYNIQLIKFWDENFLGYKKIEFLKRYAKECGLPFMIQTRPDGITEDFAKLLKKANCVNLSLGVESGNEGIRKNILKRYPKNEDIIRGFKICKKYNLRNTAFAILGLPTETKKEIFETIGLLRKCQPSTVNVFFLYPFKGTEIREWCIKNGWLDKREHKYTEVHSDYVLKNPYLTKKELLNFRKLFSMYVNTDQKYYPILERAKKDKLLYSFLNEVYTKIIHK